MAMTEEQKKLMDLVMTAIAETNLSWEQVYEVFEKIPNDDINDFIGYMKYERWKV